METVKYQGNFIKVSEEEIGGHTWERVYLSSGVVIFPFNKTGQLLIINEKRPHETLGQRYKFISGHLEQNEDVLETANRELQEEVGLKANYLEIFHEHHSNGTVNNSLYFVMAKDLVVSKLPNPDGEDSIIEQKYVKIEKLKEMLLTQQIPFSFSALGLFKLDYLISKNRIKITS